MKYFLKLELRYTIATLSIDEDKDQCRGRDYKNVISRSELFDIEKQAIDFGNKLITSNNWIEQFPGYIGQRLDRKIGRPLAVFRLKNNAEIYLSVDKIEESNFDELNEMLQTVKNLKSIKL